jgi:hypothetical protein
LFTLNKLQRERKRPRFPEAGTLPERERENRENRYAIALFGSEADQGQHVDDTTPGGAAHFEQLHFTAFATVAQLNLGESI